MAGNQRQLRLILIQLITMQNYRHILKATARLIPQGQFRKYLALLYRNNCHLKPNPSFFRDWRSLLESIVEQQSKNRNRELPKNKAYSSSRAAMSFKGFQFEQEYLERRGVGESERQEMMDLGMKMQFFYLLWMSQKNENKNKFLIFSTIRNYRSNHFLKDAKEELPGEHYLPSYNLAVDFRLKNR